MNEQTEHEEQTGTEVPDIQREAYKIWFANNIQVNRGMSFATALELAESGVRV